MSNAFSTQIYSPDSVKNPISPTLPDDTKYGKGLWIGSPKVFGERFSANCSWSGFIAEQESSITGDPRGDGTEDLSQPTIEKVGKIA